MFGLDLDIYFFRSSGFCLGSPDLHPGKDFTCASSAMPSSVQARTPQDPSKQAVSSTCQPGQDGMGTGRLVQAAPAQSRHASHHTGSYSASRGGGHKASEAAGGHVQTSYWVSFFLQSIRSTHPSTRLTCSRPLRSPWSTRPSPSPTATWIAHHPASPALSHITHCSI